MRKEDTLRLDAHFLSRRIEIRGVKLWWLAERLGVDRKTVSRWVTGKVKRLARENAEALARELDCRLEELVVSDEADVLATREEQRVAAALVQQQDLMGLLSPTENWQLAESIIKATLQPDLPLRQLGRLYNLLSIAAWRQGHYGEAEAHAARARQIGEQTADRAVITKALFNQATIDSMLSRHAASLAAYEACLAHPEGFEDRRTHGSALFNVGMVYRDFARLPASLRAIEESCAVFGALRSDFNLAIAWTGLGIVATEAGDAPRAAAALERALAHAASGNVRRYQDAVPLYQGDLLCLTGRAAEGRPLVERGFAALTAYPVHDLAAHEIRARAARLAGALDDAEAAIARGLDATRDWPTARAYLLHEAARAALARGDAAGEVSRREAANALWSSQGLGVRARRGTVAEYDRMGAPALAPAKRRR